MQATNGLPEEHLAKLQELSKGSTKIERVKVADRKEVLLDLSKLSEVSDEYKKSGSIRDDKLPKTPKTKG